LAVSCQTYILSAKYNTIIGGIYLILLVSAKNTAKIGEMWIILAVLANLKTTNHAGFSDSSISLIIDCRALLTTNWVTSGLE